MCFVEYIDMAVPLLEYVADEVLTYEEVALLQPDPQRKRPVVLIGMQKPQIMRLTLTM